MSSKKKCMILNTIFLMNSTNVPKSRTEMLQTQIQPIDFPCHRNWMGSFSPRSANFHLKQSELNYG